MLYVVWRVCAFAVPWTHCFSSSSASRKSSPSSVSISQKRTSSYTVHTYYTVIPRPFSLFLFLLLRHHDTIVFFHLLLDITPLKNKVRSLLVSDKSIKGKKGSGTSRIAFPKNQLAYGNIQAP
ncbi:hypothetical protein BX666DRAFT_1960059 [Dichotomocladium elegans]|nr:hypothetical protein BX666DRAFT_1960059 [Dichotomocladium elegans]